MAKTAPDFGDGPRPKRYPNMRPRDAASLILFDNKGAEPKFLMGRRDSGHVFMPGFFVFPGGKLERADYAAPQMFELSDHDHQRIKTTQSSVRHPKALLACAIREAREETGVLPRSPDYPAHFVARAITPPGQIRRYDTRFFAAPRDAFDAHRAKNDGEMHEVDWYRYDDIPKDRLHRITDLVLGIVNQRLMDKQDFGGAHKIPCFRMRHGKSVTDYL